MQNYALFSCMIIINFFNTFNLKEPDEKYYSKFIYNLLL